MTVSDTTGQGGEASRSASNTSTLAGYEGCADEYAETTAPKPETDDQPALVELLKVLEPASRLLEIGSGPGWCCVLLISLLTFCRAFDRPVVSPSMVTVRPLILPPAIGQHLLPH